MTDTIKIEKNIPLPPRRKNEVNEIREALSFMCVGDSFEIKMVGNDAAYIRATAKRIGIKTESRKTKGECYRIWRVE